MPLFIIEVMFLRSVFKSRRQLLLENLALRQQVTMLRQSVKRPRATVADKLFWILFSRHVDGWRKVLYGLHPDTVVRWHRQGFRFYWRWKSRGPKPGRPAINGGLRKLIRDMQAINMGWGAPRIHGELLKLGIEVSQATVSKYMAHSKIPPSQTWRNFFCERIIGSIRRDCIDHVIILNERHLRRILREYFSYYHTCRTHLSLNKDPPESRTI